MGSLNGYSRLRVVKSLTAVVVDEIGDWALVVGGNGTIKCWLFEISCC
jgi:hypothetical protein